MVALRLIRGGREDEPRAKALRLGETGVHAGNGGCATGAAHPLNTTPAQPFRGGMPGVQQTAPELFRSALSVARVTQYDVGAALDRPQQAVAKLCSGERPLTVDHVLTLCDRLAVVAVEVVVSLARRLPPGARGEVVRRLDEVV